MNGNREKTTSCIFHVSSAWLGKTNKNDVVNGLKQLRLDKEKKYRAKNVHAAAKKAALHIANQNEDEREKSVYYIRMKTVCENKKMKQCPNVFVVNFRGVTPVVTVESVSSFRSRHAVYGEDVKRKKEHKGGNVEKEYWSVDYRSSDQEYIIEDDISGSGDKTLSIKRIQKEYCPFLEDGEKYLCEVEDHPGSLCFCRGTSDAYPDYENQENSRSTERSKTQLLGDLTTEELVKHAFPNGEKSSYFVGNFVSFVQNELQEYFGGSHEFDQDKIILLYKGGNVFVDYLKRIMNFYGVDHDLDISGGFFRKILTRSDADFQVYFMNDEVFQRHHEAVKYRILAAMYKFREWLHENEDILDVDGLIDSLQGHVTEKYKDIVFSPRTNNANNANSANNVSSTDVAVMKADRNDFFVLRSGGNLASRVLGGRELQDRNGEFLCDTLVLPKNPLIYSTTRGNIDADNSPIYITFNDTTRFGNPGKRASFELMRMKLNVDLHFERNDGISCVLHAPGELIDVSFSNPDDYKIQPSKGKDIDDFTTLITMTTEHDEFIDVHIPTLDYLIEHDLFVILAVETKFPWMDPKYKKRMYRLLLGCTLLQADNLADRSTCARVNDRPSDFQREMCMTKDGENVLHTLMFLHGFCEALINGLTDGVYDYEEDGFFERYSKIKFKKNPLFNTVNVDAENPLWSNTNTDAYGNNGYNGYGEFKYFLNLLSITKNKVLSAYHDADVQDVQEGDVEVLNAYEDFVRFCEDALKNVLRFYGSFYDGISNHAQYRVNDDAVLRSSGGARVIGGKPNKKHTRRSRV